MEVTLRKAFALSTALQETARKLPLTRQVNVSIYSSKTVSDEVRVAEEALRINTQKAQDLLVAAFAVRQQVADINAVSGISKLLNEKASLDAQERILTSLGIDTNLSYDLEELETDVQAAQTQLDTLAARASNATDRYSVRESVSVTVLGAEVQSSVKARMNAIRLRKVAISEELLTINLTKRVTLPAETVALLKEYALV